MILTVIAADPLNELLEVKPIWFPTILQIPSPVVCGELAHVPEICKQIVKLEDAVSVGESVTGCPVVVVAVSEEIVGRAGARTSTVIDAEANCPYVSVTP